MSSCLEAAELSLSACQITVVGIRYSTSSYKVVFMFSSHTSSISLLATVFMMAPGCVSIFPLADRRVRNSAGVHFA